MIPGNARTRDELPHLYYPETDSMRIVNAHLGGGGGGGDFPSESEYGSFDGSNDYVDISDFDTPLTSGSIAFWINPQKLADYEGAIGLDFTSANNEVMVYWMGSGYIRIHYIDSSGSTRLAFTPTSGYLSIGVWTHLTLVRTGDQSWAIYFDGVSQSVTNTTTGGSVINNSTRAIGYAYQTLYGEARIRDVRFYSDNLTSDESLYLATAGVSGTDPTSSNLIGWWKFDDGSGTTVTDSSGNGNDGTATNITEATFWP